MATAPGDPPTPVEPAEPCAGGLTVGSVEGSTPRSSAATVAAGGFLAGVDAGFGGSTGAVTAVTAVTVGDDAGCCSPKNAPAATAVTPTMALAVSHETPRPLLLFRRFGDGFHRRWTKRRRG